METFTITLSTSSLLYQNKSRIIYNNKVYRCFVFPNTKLFKKHTGYCLLLNKNQTKNDFKKDHKYENLKTKTVLKMYERQTFSFFIGYRYRKVIHNHLKNFVLCKIKKGEIIN